MSKKIYIDGEIYIGIQAVTDKFNLSPYLINKRLRSDDYPTWSEIK